MFSHILVPLDGSSVAAQAVSYAVTLARVFDARISLFGVVEPYPEMHGIPDATAQEMDERRVTASAAYLQSVATEVRTHGLAVTTAVQHGNAADQILGYAEDEGCALIVIGSHGRTGLDRLRLGSVAQHVLRHAPIPALVVHARAEAGMAVEGQIAEVTVTLDGSSVAEEALAAAAAIATRLSVPLTLLTILHNLAFYSSFAWDGAYYYPATEEMRQSQEQWAQEYLGQVAARLRNPALDIRTAWRRSTTNRAEQLIVDYLAERPQGLAVMASHGRGGIIRFALGSTAERVLDQAACPVLLIRAGIAVRE